MERLTFYSIEELKEYLKQIDEKTMIRIELGCETEADNNGNDAAVMG